MLEICHRDSQHHGQDGPDSEGSSSWQAAVRAAVPPPRDSSGKCACSVWSRCSTHGTPLGRNNGPWPCYWLMNAGPWRVPASWADRDRSTRRATTTQRRSAEVKLRVVPVRAGRTIVARAVGRSGWGPHSATTATMSWHLDASAPVPTPSESDRSTVLVLSCCRGEQRRRHR